MDDLILFLVFTAAAFAISAVLTKRLIPFLRKKKMGQKILEDGPNWHKSKEGTPTMGGIAFILTIAIMLILAVIYFVVNKEEVKDDSLGKMLVCFAFAFLCGCIGIIDDLAKFSHGKNEGLKAYQKYFLQLVVSALFLLACRLLGYISTVLYIPFFDVSVKLGIWYYLVMLVLLTGIINSVNLTDGIDGLAASVTSAVMLFLVLFSFRKSESGLFLLSSATAGGCLGFLVFNFHPAKVFMGDTGSLFLGGMFIGICTLLSNPLISVVLGIIYIIETASVMLQVAYFKLTHGKRLFKMSPIHHHFEKCGWSEVKIVTVFSLVTVIFGVLSYFGI